MGNAMFYYRDQSAPVPTQRPHAGMCAIVCCGDKILMEHRSDSDLWGLIGGGLEIGETLAEGMARELLEETGIALSADALRFFRLYDDPSRIVAFADGNVMQLLTAAYTVTLSQLPSLVCSEESTALGFFTRSEIETLPVAATHLHILQDYWNATAATPCP